MPIDYSSQTVLLTGASSGIGRELAIGLARRGAALVIVARREQRLQELAHQLRTDYGATVHVLAQDLSAPTVHLELRRAVDALDIQITSLINNAGFGTFGPFIGEDLHQLDREIAVDIATPMRLSAEFLPDMVSAGRGFLINVASMAAYTPTPRMAVYGASKAFILHFTESLWAELRGSGVLAFALSPGATGTEFNSVVGTDDATAGARMRTAADVAQTAFTHLDRRNPGPSAIDGMPNRIAASMLGLLSRRATATLMNRLTDPGRRDRTSAR